MDLGFFSHQIAGYLKKEKFKDVKKGKKKYKG
jgi:hypothetical protein